MKNDGRELERIAHECAPERDARRQLEARAQSDCTVSGSAQHRKRASENPGRIARVAAFDRQAAEQGRPAGASGPPRTAEPQRTQVHQSRVQHEGRIASAFLEPSAPGVSDAKHCGRSPDGVAFELHRAVPRNSRQDTGCGSENGLSSHVTGEPEAPRCGFGSPGARHARFGCGLRRLGRLGLAGNRSLVGVFARGCRGLRIEAHGDDERDRVRCLRTRPRGEATSRRLRAGAHQHNASRDPACLLRELHPNSRCIRVVREADPRGARVDSSGELRSRRAARRRVHLEADGRCVRRWGGHCYFDRRQRKDPRCCQGDRVARCG